MATPPPSEHLQDKLINGEVQQTSIAVADGGTQSQVPVQLRQSWIESAEAFESTKSLASELRKARIRKGRIRGQIKRLEEQADNIIITDGDDEALVAKLGEEVDQWREALAEAGAYVLALEMRYDQLNERNSREIARSRVSAGSRSGASSRAQLRFDTGSEGDQRSLISGRVSPRAMLFQSQQQEHVHSSANAPLPVLNTHQELNRGFLRITPSQPPPVQAPVRSTHHEVERFDLASRSRVSTGREAGSILPSGQPVEMVNLRPEDSISEAARCARDQGQEYQMHMERGRSQQRTAAAATGKPFCDAGTVGKLSISGLRDIFRVTAHIRRVESILVEANAGRFINDQFVPHGHLANACKEKLLSTLKEVPDCHDTANNACDIDGATWVTVTRALKDKFARRTVLAAELEQRLKKLRFSSAKEADSFVKDAISIGDLYRVVFPGDRAQERHLVRRVVSCLPKDVATGVIRRCRLRQDTGCEQDWETSVMFHSPTCSTHDTIVEYILAECRLSEEVGSLLSQKPGARDGGQDSVRIIQPSDGRQQKDKNGGERGESLSSFAARFSVVYGVTGRGCRDENALTSLLAPGSLIPRFNKQGMRYFFAGFKDSNVGASKVQALPRDQFRTWEFRPRGEPRADGDGSSAGRLLTGIDDQIRALSNPSLPDEIHLSASLRRGMSSDSPTVYPATCIIDTAAGGSYLLVRDLSECDGLDLCSTDPLSISLADGTVTRVSYGVSCAIAVFTEDGLDLACDYQRCRLRVLVCSSVPLGGQYKVLAGRELIDRWGLVLYGVRQGFINGRCVFRRSAPSDEQGLPDDMVCRLIESVGSVDDVLCHLTPLTGIDAPLQSSAEASGILLPKLTKEESSCVDRSLSSVVDEGWVPLPRTNQAYHSRVRKLLPCEFVDLPGVQTHVCEVRVPEPRGSSNQGASYARSLYLRLPAELQKEYKRLVSEYLASNWWVPVARDAVVPRQQGTSRAAAQVFLIPPNETRKKARLVVDFRPYNRTLSPAGNDQPPISFVLRALRAESRECIGLADARSAFYKCRLANTTLLLETGDSNEFLFQSIRMCFGVVFGPSGLSGGLGRLGGSLRSCDLSVALLCLVLLFIFVDDLCVSGPTRATIIQFKLLLSLLLRAGFDAQLRKVSVLCADCRRDELRSCLEEAGLELEIADEGVLLGVKLRYAGERLILNCDRSRRISQVVKFLADIKEKEVTTKRRCFKGAGCLAFDSGQQHVWARSCADALRALIGKLYAKVDWASAIDLSALTGDARSALECILQWMEDLCSETCEHSSPVRFDDRQSLELEAVCDASNSGGGYVIRTVEGTVILSCAVRWRKGERLWHSNRRELCMLLRMLQDLSDFLHFRQRSTCGSANKPSVTVLCDNKSCVLWSQSSDSPEIVEASRAIERRAIARLLDGLHAELVALRSLCSLRICHVAGHKNQLADALSRAYDRSTPNGKSLADCLCSIGDSEDLPRDPTRSGIGWAKPSSKDPLDPGWEPDAEDVAVADEALCALDLAHTRVDNPLSYPFSLAAHGLTRGASALDTVSLLGYDSDKVFRVCEAPSDGSEPVIERFARHSYDISQLARLVWAARSILSLLRCHAKKSELEIPDFDREQCDQLAARCVQQVSAKYGEAVDNPKSSVLRPCGPIFRCIVKGIQRVSYLAFRTGSAAGSVSYCPIIPKDTPTTFFRALIIRSAHRETRHGSLPATAALITDFHLPSINQDVRKLSKSCFICQVSRARRVWTEPPSIGKGHVMRLQFHQPYYRVGVDYFALGDRRKVISVTCLFSGHCTWYRVPADGGGERETIDATVSILRRAQLERGGIRELVCDMASYFASSKFVNRAREVLGASVEPLSARSPFEGGKYEKLHDLGARKMRVLLRGSSGRVSTLSDSAVDDMLLEVCFILNTRPTLYYSFDAESGKRCITPDLLCFGYTRVCGGQFGFISSEKSIRPARDVAKIRREFVDYHWRALKERSLGAVKSKCPASKLAKNLSIGATVLVYAPNRKLGYPWKIGHVLAFRGDHTVDVIYPGKAQRVVTENIFNLVAVEHEKSCDAVDDPDDPMFDCERESLDRPSLIGMPLWILLNVRGQRKKFWYAATVVRVFKSGHVEVDWHDGVSARERLWLDSEEWQLRDFSDEDRQRAAAEDSRLADGPEKQSRREGRDVDCVKGRAIVN